MAYQPLELWSSDQKLMEYMLDRLTIAKLIESTGKSVPDNYTFYFDGPTDYISSDDYMDSIDDFLHMSKIGNLKFRTLKEHDLVVSIHLYALDEIQNYSLSVQEKSQLESICTELSSYFGAGDYCTVEGKFHVVGSRLYVRGDGIYGPSFEICKHLLEVHQNVQALIKNVRSHSKGAN